MLSKYYANPNTMKWHIVGYCHISKNPDPNVKIFDSEEALYEHYGRKIIPCLLCQKTKEKKLTKGD